MRFRAASIAVFAVASVFVAAPGCGGGSSGSPDGSSGTAGAVGTNPNVGAHGCTNVQASCSSNNGLSCEEYAGYDASIVAAFQAGCNHPKQMWSTSPCDRTNVVGACAAAANGTCSEIWSLPPVTADALKADCMGLDQFFVAP